jgi:hypothetical protein
MVLLEELRSIAKSVELHLGLGRSAEGRAAEWGAERTEPPARDTDAPLDEFSRRRPIAATRGIQLFEEEVEAARPMADFDAEYKVGERGVLSFLRVTYRSLKK